MTGYANKENMAPTPGIVACRKSELAFETELAAEEKSDEVQLWCDYVKYAFDQKGSKTDANDILQRACIRLAAVHRYRDDIRHLRLWVRHANTLEEPENVFEVLSEQDIGVRHALFYEAWAACLEKKRLFDDVKAVYERGIRLEVQPLERLLSRYEEFRQRQRRRAKRDHRQSKLSVSQDELQSTSDFVPCPTQFETTTTREDPKCKVLGEIAMLDVHQEASHQHGSSAVTTTDRLSSSPPRVHSLEVLQVPDGNERPAACQEASNPRCNTGTDPQPQLLESDRLEACHEAPKHISSNAGMKSSKPFSPRLSSSCVQPQVHDEIKKSETYQETPKQHANSTGSSTSKLSLSTLPRPSSSHAQPHVSDESSRADSYQEAFNQRCNTGTHPQPQLLESDRLEACHEAPKQNFSNAGMKSSKPMSPRLSSSSAQPQVHDEINKPEPCQEGPKQHANSTGMSTSNLSVSTPPRPSSSHAQPQVSDESSRADSYQESCNKGAHPQPQLLESDRLEACQDASNQRFSSAGIKANKPSSPRLSSSCAQPQVYDEIDKPEACQETPKQHANSTGTSISKLPVSTTPRPSSSQAQPQVLDESSRADSYQAVVEQHRSSAAISSSKLSLSPRLSVPHSEIDSIAQSLNTVELLSSPAADRTQKKVLEFGPRYPEQKQSEKEKDSIFRRREYGYECNGEIMSVEEVRAAWVFSNMRKADQGEEEKEEGKAVKGSIVLVQDNPNTEACNEIAPSRSTQGINNRMFEATDSDSKEIPSSSLPMSDERPKSDRHTVIGQSVSGGNASTREQTQELTATCVRSLLRDSKSSRPSSAGSIFEDPTYTMAEVQREVLAFFSSSPASSKGQVVHNVDDSSSEPELISTSCSNPILQGTPSPLQASVPPVDGFAIFEDTGTSLFPEALSTQGARVQPNVGMEIYEDTKTSSFLEVALPHEESIHANGCFDVYEDTNTSTFPSVGSADAAVGQPKAGFEVLEENNAARCESGSSYNRRTGAEEVDLRRRSSGIPVWDDSEFDAVCN